MEPERYNQLARLTPEIIVPDVDLGVRINPGHFDILTGEWLSELAHGMLPRRGMLARVGDHFGR